MKVTGKIEFVKSRNYRKIFEEGAFIEELIGKPLGHLWKIFRIHSSEALFFTLADKIKVQGSLRR